MNQLTILIPTLPQRAHMLSELIGELMRQGQPRELIFTDDHTDITIGVKRNDMMALVETSHMAFFDDDDWPGPNYITRNMEGVTGDYDCCSLTGCITTDGQNLKTFIHSIEYTEMFEHDGIYYRPPLHINVIKTALAKQCVFPDWKYSEDSNFCFQLRDKGLLKREYLIDEVIYYYRYISDKKRAGL